MLAMPGLRSYSLAEDRGRGVSFNKSGVFVAGVALLQPPGVDTDRRWRVRPTADLNGELTTLYRLPIDVAAKTNALALIAEAFNRGELALAAIATVQMRWPAPPPPTVFETDSESQHRAQELYYSGLLKAGWDPLKHPRAGTKPNPGWFALVPKDLKVPGASPTGPKIPRSGWPQAHVNRDAREFAKSLGPFVRRNAGKLLLFGVELNPWIDVFLLGYTPTELNQGEDRLTAQLKAALQPFPKSLEELQQSPADDVLGYEPHHIVGQNRDNLLKITLAKFGREKIDDPSNIVWLPRFLHEEVSAWYSESSDGPGSPLRRDAINKMDFAEQREQGLKILRELRILK